MKTIFGIITLFLVLSVTVEAQNVAVGKTWRMTSSNIITVDTTGAGTDDTLRLGSNAFSWVQLRIVGAAADSVGDITGGVAGNIYEFSVVANDSTVTFRDQGRLKLGGARLLNKTTDRLMLKCIDGTNFVEWLFISND